MLSQMAQGHSRAVDVSWPERQQFSHTCHIFYGTTFYREAISASKYVQRHFEVWMLCSHKWTVFSPLIFLLHVQRSHVVHSWTPVLARHISSILQRELLLLWEATLSVCNLCAIRVLNPYSSSTFSRGCNCKHKNCAGMLSLLFFMSKRNWMSFRGIIWQTHFLCLVAAQCINDWFLLHVSFLNHTGRTP